MMTEETAAVAVVKDKTILTYIQIPIELRKEIGDIFRLKYLNNYDAIDKNELKEFEKIIRHGIIRYKEIMHDSKSSLLHKEKKPTKKVWKKLGSIATEFLKCHTYPKISGNSLMMLLNKALGNMDPRPVKDYRATVLQYCNISDNAIKRCSHDQMFGELDVSFFVSLIPRQYISVTAATAATTEEIDDE